MVLVLALIVSIRLNFVLWKKAERANLLGQADLLEWRARGSATLN